jgi:hypothetical protein
MKKIELNKATNIFIASIINYNKDILKKELYKNFEFGQETEKDGLMISGEQSILLINSEEINNVKSQCIRHIQSIENLPNQVYYTKNWIYINDNKTKNTFYHDHIKNKVISFLKNEWVYTFYLQIPNNLNGNEGYLFFKTNDGVEHKLLPNEGEVIIFPAHLLHRPELSPNSTQERIVLGGVYTHIDMNSSYNKSIRTLF